jgi:hypothetical protein
MDRMYSRATLCRRRSARARRVNLEGFRMGSVPLNRARAQLICTWPQNQMTARVQGAVVYLEKLGATEDERRLAAEATAWLQRRQDEPQADSKQAAGKQNRRGGSVAPSSQVWLSVVTCWVAGGSSACPAGLLGDVASTAAMICPSLNRVARPSPVCARARCADWWPDAARDLIHACRPQSRRRSLTGERTARRHATARRHS